MSGRRVREPWRTVPAPAAHRSVPLYGALRCPGRRSGSRRSRRGDERGDTLAFLVLWPAMIMAVLLLGVHAFIVVNAQAEASLAASAGLRAAWRSAADSDLGTVARQYTGGRRHLAHSARLDAAGEMTDRAVVAVQQVAGDEGGWRWWTGAAASVYSDWCYPAPEDYDGDELPLNPGLPLGGESGWVRIVVSGEVIGPLSWILPGRLDTVYATAEGPAVLRNFAGAGRAGDPGDAAVPEQWAQADLVRC